MFEKFLWEPRALTKNICPLLWASFVSVSMVAFKETERRSEWLARAHID